MGHVIQLPSVENATFDFERDAHWDFSIPSADEIEKAISHCGEVQRQIEILLLIAIKADRMIDNIRDADLQTRLREKRARSYMDLLGARGRVSLTIASLTKALSPDDIARA
jgi:hypothetical protein